MNCVICNTELSGNKRKYCNESCRNKYRYASSSTFREEHKKNTYRYQKIRAIERKRKLVAEFGGRCELCGYSENLAALTFHHTDPSTKSMKLDSRKLSGSSWAKIAEEAKKCQLLCSNCHMEVHYPSLRLREKAD